MSHELGSALQKKMRLMSEGEHPSGPPIHMGGLPAHFELQGELGRGGMGVVFRAYDRKEQRDVALKIIPVQTGSMAKRFRREAEELERLSHEYIVAFYSIEQLDDRELLVMEFVDGGNLLGYISEPHSIPEVLEVFVKICEGLQCIHDVGLVHRDLKPENVLMTSSGIPKITDFGLARRLEGRSKLTSDGTILGTYSYLAPEQVLTSEVGPAADLYALGAVMFEAFTGRTPFIADTEYGLLQAHIREVPPSPKALRQDLPAAVEKLILKLLKKRPEERPGSPAEVAEVLRACLRGEQAPLEPGSEGELLGRGEELAKLEECLARCLEGGRAQALLTATNGMGRTRLVQEICNRLTTRRLKVLRLAPESDSLLRGMSDVYAALGGQPERFFQYLVSGGAPAGAEALRRRLAANPGTVLVADDMERLSATCQNVLARLASLSPGPGSGWLLSYTVSRAVDLPLHPDTTVVELSQLSYDTVIALASLQLAVLSENTRRLPLDPTLREWITTRAGGSPRKLKLMLLGLLQSHAVVIRADVWQCAAAVPLPASTNDCLIEEVTKLDEGLLRLLRPASLLAQPFAFELICDVSQVAEAECEAGLDRLVSLGLLEEAWTSRGEQLAFSSEEVRKALADGLTDRTRKRIHQRVAQVLTHADGTSAAQGSHLAEAQQTSQALPLLVEGAEQSQARGAFMEAHEIWLRAAECVVGDATPGLQLRIQLGSGESLARSGRPEEAIALLDGLLERPPAGLLEEYPYRLFAYRRLVELKADAGAPSGQLLDLCRRGLREVGLPPEASLAPPKESDPALHRQAAGVYKLMSRMWLEGGDREQATAYLRAASVQARLAGEQAVEAELALLEGRLHLANEVLAGAESSFTRSQTLGTGPLGPPHVLRCQHGLAQVYLEVAKCGGELPGPPVNYLVRAEECLTAALDIAEELADASWQARVLTTQAELRVLQGGSTIESLQRAVAVLRPEGVTTQLVEQMCWLGQAYAGEMMDFRRAEATLVEAYEVSEESDHPELAATAAVFLGFLGRQQVRLDDAGRWFTHALEIARDKRPQALARTGFALILPADQPETCQQAEEAVRLSEGLSPFHQGLAYWALATCMLALNDEVAAEDALRRVKKMLVGIPPQELKSLVAEARQTADRYLKQLGPEGANPDQNEHPHVQPTFQRSLPRPEPVDMQANPYTRIPRRTQSPLVRGLKWLFTLGLALACFLWAPPYVRGMMSNSQGNFQLKLAQTSCAIRIDGSDIQLTPWSKTYGTTLAPGPHNVTVRAPYRLPSSFQVTIVAGSKLVKSVSLASTVGTLLVRSNVNHAQVYLNGHKEGTLSIPGGGDNRPALKLERMEPGTYEVELRLKGYVTRSTKVTFEAGEVETVNLELKLK